MFLGADSVRAVRFRAFCECYEWLELGLLSPAKGHCAPSILEADMYGGKLLKNGRSACCHRDIDCEISF